MITKVSCHLNNIICWFTRKKIFWLIRKVLLLIFAERRVRTFCNFYGRLNLQPQFPQPNLTHWSGLSPFPVVQGQRGLRCHGLIRGNSWLLPQIQKDWAYDKTWITKAWIKCQAWAIKRASSTSFSFSFFFWIKYHNLIKN